MKFFTLFLLYISYSFSQIGHIMPAAGAKNASMAGASTGQAIDISGSLYWNSASISQFKFTELSFSAALFFAEPIIHSTMPMPGGGLLNGNTTDKLGVSILPTMSFIFASESDFTFGFSLFGVSGFGVDYPRDNNYAGDLQGNANPNYDPNDQTNSILTAQYAGGFGHLKSQYQLMQISPTVAYELSDGLSIGFSPVLNYAMLDLAPLPIASPDPMKGYPRGKEQATALGYGFHTGLFYAMENGFSLGFSYKSPQSFDAFELKSAYHKDLGGGDAPKTTFTLDFPQIISVGLGYSNENFDFAFDWRTIDYENTDGFDVTGFNATGAVKGFGWENMTVMSFGLQYKGFDKLPIRFGYTHNSNPINSDNVFYSASAPAIIENAINFGVSYELNETILINVGYHLGLEAEVAGPMRHPQMGEISGSEVKTVMTTSNILFGLNYKL